MDEDAADAAEVEDEVVSTEVDVENQDPETVENIVVHSTMDVAQSFMTTKTCVTPMDGTSPTVTPAPLAKIQINIMNLMQLPMIQREHADCTNAYLTKHEDVGRGIV